MSFCATACLCNSQRLSPTSCCSCCSSGQAAQALRLGGGPPHPGLAARCLLGIVVLLAGEGGSRACNVNKHTENSKTHLPLRERRPALTDASFDWPTRLPIFPFSSTISCAEAQVGPPIRAQLKSSLMALIFTGQKTDPAERGGAWTRRDPRP